MNKESNYKKLYKLVYLWFFTSQIHSMKKAELTVPDTELVQNRTMLNNQNLNIKNSLYMPVSDEYYCENLKVSEIIAFKIAMLSHELGLKAFTVNINHIITIHITKFYKNELAVLKGEYETLQKQFARGSKNSQIAINKIIPMAILDFRSYKSKKHSKLPVDYPIGIKISMKLTPQATPSQYTQPPKINQNFNINLN